MRYLLLTFIFFFTSLFLQAQTGKDIIAALKSINTSVGTKFCGTDSAAAISNRAMNIFMADKTGYLSASTDLSYFTNYVTFNTAEGKFTVSHNFQQAAGIDDPVKKLFNIGFDMTIANSYAKSFLDKRFENELDLSICYTWLGKVKTTFESCEATQSSINQKQAMDALRIAMLQSLEAEISKKEIDFNAALNAIDSSSVPGQNIQIAKTLMQQNFYTNLRALYEEKFAALQSALLTKTNNFKSISTHWTSFTAYAPLLFPKYTISRSFTTSFDNKHPYPFNAILGHTRMWENSKAGRIFFTLMAGLLFNNSKLTYGLSKLNYSEYKNLGGTGTQQITDPGNNKLYIGQYETFVTPSLTARLVYFPHDSHIGASVLVEQNIGKYNLLNAKLAIPIVLINSKKTPAVNIECYLLLFNLTNKTSLVINQGKSAVGVSIGIPFSRLMY
ncbi:MAG: hypothetical protein ABJB86_12605 [Bacteroidota bacterium]